MIELVILVVDWLGTTSLRPAVGGTSASCDAERMRECPSSGTVARLGRSLARARPLRGLSWSDWAAIAGSTAPVDCFPSLRETPSWWAGSPAVGEGVEHEWAEYFMVLIMTSIHHLKSGVPPEMPGYCEEEEVR